MKIHESLVTEVVIAMSRDIAVTFPNLSSAVSKQLCFTQELLAQQGLAFATLVLPQCGKWFDHCLSEGRILPDRPLYHGHRKDSAIPKYLWFLWNRVFTDEGVILAEPDLTAVFFLRQSYYFAKKLEIECDAARTQDSVAAFRAAEESMVRPWPNTWSSDAPEWGPVMGHPLWGTVGSPRQDDLFAGLDNKTGDKLPRIPWQIFDRLCRRLISSWGDLDVWSLKPKHGPGAVSEGRTLKYEFENYSRRLNAIFPADWFTSHDYSDRTRTDRDIGSVMHAVPKTQKGPRLIAAEPVSNQWIQGALQRWLEKRVIDSPLGLSIGFRDQHVSQKLALESSSTGEYATVDLSEASDRLSCRLVQYVFQGNLNLLDAFHACRTQHIHIPEPLSDKGPREVIELRKFSTMGSALTFPVQTIVFTMIAHFAVMMTHEDWDVSLAGMRRRAHMIRVFGDDIIIDTESYGNLVRILHECGLKVNENKSFHRGKFREACGMDAFDGVDVTPAYIKQPYSLSNPESLASIIQVSNNFHKKGMWHTADRILKTVAQKELKFILRSHQDVWPLSLFTYQEGTDLTNFKTRWNPNLHRREVYAMSPSSKVSRIRGEWNASLLQYFTEEPDLASLSKWEAGQAERPRHSKRTRWVGPV